MSSKLSPAELAKLVKSMDEMQKLEKNFKKNVSKMPPGPLRDAELINLMSAADGIDYHGNLPLRMQRRAFLNKIEGLVFGKKSSTKTKKWHLDF